jgi:hypothetical protein
MIMVLDLVRRGDADGYSGIERLHIEGVPMALDDRKDMPGSIS